MNQSKYLRLVELLDRYTDLTDCDHEADEALEKRARAAAVSIADLLLTSGLSEEIRQWAQAKMLAEVTVRVAV